MARQVGGQVVGNIGTYYAAYRLSQQGWSLSQNDKGYSGAANSCI